MEPFRASSQTEASPTEDKESDSDSKSKKRQRAASHLHIVKPDKEQVPKPESEKSAEAKAEPTSLAELFEVKVAKAEKAEPDHAKHEVEPSEDVIDEQGNFTEQGEQAAASTLAEKNLESIPEHDPTDMSPEAAADLAAELLNSKVADGADIESAAVETNAEMDVTPAEVDIIEKEIPSTLPPEVIDEEPAEIESEVEKTEPIELADDETVPAEQSIAPAAEVAPDEDDEANPTSSASSQAAGTSQGSTAVAPTLSPSPMPPYGPLPPFGGSPGGPSGPGGSGGSGGPGGPGHPNAGPNLYPAPVLSGNLNTPPSTELYDSGNPVVMALVGYLIGRRRGRRKAEKRAAKAHVKYERKVKKQIENIDWQLKAKEQQVRKLAAEKARRDGPLFVETLVVAKAAKSVETKPLGSEKIQPAAIGKRPEQPKAERRAAPEASVLHGAKAHEHIGHVLITAAEAPPKINPAPELARAKQPEQVSRQATERQVETLSRAELLAISEKIIIDGSSLKQIYDTHLIGERGLRRLVAEHLHGGDVKKILRREIVEHEIDFERDPAVRDAAADAVSAPLNTTATGKATLDKLVRQASVGFGDNNPAAAYYKARAAYEAQEQAEEKSRRRLVDVGLVAVITALTLAVVILFLTRH